MEHFKPSKSETGGADSNDWKYKNQAGFKGVSDYSTDRGAM